MVYQSVMVKNKTPFLLILLGCDLKTATEWWPRAFRRRTARGAKGAGEQGPEVFKG